jgi:hypothetical protein
MFEQRRYTIVERRLNGTCGRHLGIGIGISTYPSPFRQSGRRTSKQIRDPPKSRRCRFNERHEHHSILVRGAVGDAFRCLLHRCGQRLCSGVRRIENLMHICMCSPGGWGGRGEDVLKVFVHWYASDDDPRAHDRVERRGDKW